MTFSQLKKPLRKLKPEMPSPKDPSRPGFFWVTLEAAKAKKTTWSFVRLALRALSP